MEELSSQNKERKLSVEKTFPVSTRGMGLWDNQPILVSDLKNSMQSTLNIIGELASGRLVEISYRDTHRGKSITATFTPIGLSK